MTEQEHKRLEEANRIMEDIRLFRDARDILMDKFVAKKPWIEDREIVSTAISRLSKIELADIFLHKIMQLEERYKEL